MNRFFLCFLLLTFNLVFALSDTIDQTEAKKKLAAQNKFYKSPGKAMLLSTILPGAGQFYTENYLKGAIITLTWGTLGCFSIREHHKATDALTISDTNTYIEHRDRRNNFLWWTAAVWVFSIADAYVASNMYKFKEQETFSYNLELEPKLTISLLFKKPL